MSAQTPKLLMFVMWLKVVPGDADWQAEKNKKRSIPEACSTQWAVTFQPVNQLSDMMDRHHWDTKPLPWFCCLVYFQITKSFLFLESLQIPKKYSSLSQILFFSLPQLLGHIRHLFLCLFLCIIYEAICPTDPLLYHHQVTQLWERGEPCAADMVSVGLIYQHLWKHHPLIQMLNVQSGPRVKKLL